MARARAHFENLVAAWRPTLDATLDTERKALTDWIRARADELCGPAEKQTALFENARAPAWKTLSDPGERLAAFAVDPSNPSSARGDARTVVELHRRRSEALERRAALDAPALSSLGMLLLVPAGGPHGA